MTEQHSHLLFRIISPVRWQTTCTCEGRYLLGEWSCHSTIWVLNWGHQLSLPWYAGVGRGHTKCWNSLPSPASYQGYHQPGKGLGELPDQYYTTESRHNDTEKLDFMWHFFTSAFLAKFDVTLQQGRHWESKCSWLSLAGPCSLPRLIPGQGPLWHQQTFHVFTEMLGTERSIKIECWTLPWLQGAEPRHGRAAAAIHTVPKDQVT